MPHQIFLSYAIPDQDLVENLADQLQQFGIKTWVYSLDRALSSEIWKDIEANVIEAELFAFVTSTHSKDSAGQHRELEIVVDRFQNSANYGDKILPIVVGDTPFSGLPDKLRNINGVRLDIYSVRSTAFEIAKTFFPDLFDKPTSDPWNFPKPGQWLEVSNLSPGIEEFLSLRDPLYFRRISPLGLFECYSPKLMNLFWISPINVCTSLLQGGECPSVPKQFRYETALEYERIGLDVVKNNG